MRNPWVAGLLSLLTPGAGHLYAGDVRGAALFCLAAFTAGSALKVSYAAIGYSTRLYLAVLVVLSAGFIAAAAYSAWRAARRFPERPVRLYQRLWFVVVAAIVLAEAQTRAARAFVMEPLHVPNAAMAPTLLKGDFLLVTKLGPRATPERGAIVAFRPPHRDDIEVVKRVVAREGDRVEVRDGAVWVNGEEASRSFVPGWEEPLTVPARHIYVVGDNAAESGLDSRTLGPISLDRYVGRVHGVYMSSSWSRIGTTL